MTRLERCSVLALLCAAGACDSPAAPLAESELPDVAERLADPTLGHQAFVAECAGCHASRDGFDLAFFSFPDSTIVRRALGHVDTTTAFDIAAYINTLPVVPVGRFDQSFQPGGVELTGDVEFATTLFGSDSWPSALTTAELLAIDPTQVPIALTFPRWSFEESNLDWMPDDPFPEGLLRHSQNRAGDALRRYQASGTDDALYDAAIALRIAERDPKSTMAPCQLEEPVRFEADDCFQARRWTASLVAQHMLRSGSSEPMHFSLHDAWWDVGNVARKSLQHGVPIDNAEENWAVWMYLGWAFAPQRHASTYLATALARKDLPRHATFHTLRTQVARVEATGDPYQDLNTAIRVAPRGWVADVAIFSFRNLIERLEAGDVPSDRPFRNVKEGMPESQLDKAWTGLQRARIRLLRSLPSEELESVTPLYERVLELLPPL
ncbi:MAG: hypothetical protein IIB36_11330 [Gemmatimonadetes bacterium]|nr:hypothetical protein [Gemmatimonadota bacterium]